MSGIVNNSVNYATIRENLFTGIGMHPAYLTVQDTAHIGIILNNAHVFTVEQNTFKGAFNGADHTLGILTNNSGGEPITIQLNTFDSLYVANQAEKVNVSLDPQIGLQYWCNDNLGANSYDFFVAPGGSIAASQGSGQGTKNTFSLNGNNPASDFDNEGDLPILYYHRNILAEEPMSIFGINLEQVSLGVDCGEEGEENPSPLPNDTITSLAQKFTLNKDLADSLKNEYLIALDGGDTQGLLATVENATHLNAGAVQQQLLDASPWLTTPVLQAFLNRQDVFDDDAMYYVLSSNPDEIRAPAMQDILYSELTTGLAETIVQSTNSITARTALLNAYSYYSAAAFRSANRIIKDIVYDTLNYDVGSFRLWLRKKGTMEAWYELAETYVAENDSLAAMQVLDSIPLIFNLSALDSVELGYFKALNVIQFNFQNTHHSLMGLDSSTINEMITIADSCAGLAGTHAQGFLNTTLSYTYRLNPQYPYMAPGERSADVIYNQTEDKTTAFINAFPNPSTGEVTFRYQLPNGLKEALIVIINTHGRYLYQKVLTDEETSFTWVPKDGIEGIFFFKVIASGKIIEAGKLVIFH